MDILSRKARSDVMARIRSVNTQPERRVRSVLSRIGVRSRSHVKALPGRPDIVVASRRLAIEVRGCFWHGHTCKAAKAPSTNVRFWTEKIESNRRRDRRNVRLLRALGWSVCVLWTCRIERLTDEQLTGLLRRRLDRGDVTATQRV
jgi:DNA mismatch endonuclease (patch repair protein)